ncbi:MAG: serine/threonine protein kinase [Kofleriaceae bacterium]|nr:serine/threonine protein kinase [Kofleriaceae bacterium]
MLERIGNCRIVEEVASGGMAVVYRAIQDPLGRTVAIKALKTSVATQESIATRFEREARSLAALQHENIIHVYDFHQERGALFIVMEFVQGTDLYDLLDRCGRLPYDVAAIAAMQVARALDYVHYRGIVHRDIKPANIMLSRSGGVKVMDFGIARDKNFEDLTEAGTGIGTPAYMSPEQVLGDKLDSRSDIFSLGVVLYQMLTGKKPFVEDEQKSAMHKIRLEPHMPVRKLNPEIPRELERIVDKCLEKRPADRWRSAQHMVIALERFLAKHVEMNHHARIVMFLRGQNVITELEAEEYLNPQVLSNGAATLLQTNMAARQTERQGVLAHGIMFGVLALMFGLIHVAPLGATPETQTLIKQQGRGFVRVSAYPWAQVSIDGEVRATTPRAAAIEVTEGMHTVRFSHPWYQPVERSLVMTPSTMEAAQTLTVDFEQEGKLRPGGIVPTLPSKVDPAVPGGSIDDDGAGVGSDSATGGAK